MDTPADLVDRNFARHEPDRLWVTDVTEHPTREPKVYYAVVLDTFSRHLGAASPASFPPSVSVEDCLN